MEKGTVGKKEEKEEKTFADHSTNGKLENK